MPYISIQAYPRDEKIKNELVEKINQALLDVWGCPQEAISIALEEVAPEEWDEKVKKSAIRANMSNMRILDGEKITANGK